MFCTRISFSKLEAWFYQSHYDYLLLYVSDFHGQDGELVPWLIKNRYVYNTLTGHHICFIHFLPEKYFVRHARFIYMKDHVGSPAENRWDNSYIPYDADFFSEQDYRRKGGMDISATLEASDEICKCFDISHIDLPAFVMIPKTNLAAGDNRHVIYPLKSIADIDTFFNALSLIKGYEEDREKAEGKSQQLKQEIENAEAYLRRLDAEICDISGKIRRQEISVQEKEKEILPVLDAFVLLPPERPRSPSSIKSILEEQGRLETFFASKEARNRFSDFLHEFEKLDELKTELTQKQLGINKLKHKLEKIARCGGLQQALILAHEESERQLKTLDSEFLNALQRRYLLTKEQRQQFIGELKSPAWLSFSCIAALIENLREKCTIIGNDVAALEEKIERYAFDTFISCSSKDYESAEKLKEYLEKKGLKPFLASVSLREIGSSHYGEVIRKVLEICRNFVLFATCNDYVINSYVYHEWNAYIEDKYRGRHQNGKLVPVINDVRIGDQLPLALRNLQMFSANSYKQDGLAEFLKNGDNSARN